MGIFIGIHSDGRVDMDGVNIPGALCSFYENGTKAVMAVMDNTEIENGQPYSPVIRNAELSGTVESVKAMLKFLDKIDAATGEQGWRR